MPFDIGPPPIDLQLAIRAWNLFGGEVDYAGLDLVMAVIGYHDVELLIDHFALIREHKRQKNE